MFGHARSLLRTQEFWSLLQHAESLVVICELLVVACGIHFPDQDLLLWEHGVLATGPPGKSLGERLIRNSAMKGQVDTKWVLRSVLAPLNLGHPDIMCLLMWWYNRNCTPSLVVHFWLRKKKVNLKPIKYLHLKPDCKKHREQKSYIMPQGSKSLNQKGQ